MDPVLTLILGSLIILAIIAANGFFVAQEFAYMSVDRVRLQTAAKAGDRAAARALQVTRRTSFMLSGAQLGITVTGLMVGYVAEPMVGAALTELLGTWSSDGDDENQLYGPQGICLDEARDRVYDAVERISLEGSHFRTDIALAAQRNELHVG